MKRAATRLAARLAALVLFFNSAPAWACPECRAQVESGVYGEGFAGTLLVLLLPLVLIALVGVAIYYANDIKAELKGRVSRWQTAHNARR